MVLRRIIAHLRSQQWTGIGIEFAIVIIGVFLGIQASNLNSARIDRALESEYTERVVGDLDAIIATARSQRQFEQNKSKQVVAALGLTQAVPSDGKSLQLGHLLTLLTVRLSPNFESPTFSDLQNSGRLSLIRDAELRTQLSAYFAHLQYLRGAIRLNNDSFAEALVDFLRREGIGAGYGDPALAGDATVSAVDAELSALSRSRLGRRDITAHSSALRLSPKHPFWERVRASLTWRGQGAIANERILNMIVSEATTMKREVVRRRAGGRS